MSAHSVSTLIDYLGSFTKLSESLVKMLNVEARSSVIPKGQIYIRKGGYDKSLGFLCSGIMRIYDTDSEGQEWNKALLTYQTMLLGNPNFGQKSIHTIASISNCEILELPLNIFEEALVSYPELQVARAEIMIGIYNRKSERESDLLSLSAKDRFLKLKRELGEVIHEIPQYHIASYLGITPIQLSRIKSSLTG